MADITISKNGISIIINAQEVTENLSNNIFLITPPQTTQKQSSGPKDPKAIDLLRITTEYMIRGEITGTTTPTVLTAKQVKDSLKSIFKGANANGGVCSLVYDGDTINGYITKCMFNEVSMDKPDTEPDDFAKYTVQITFAVGIPV